MNAVKGDQMHADQADIVKMLWGEKDQPSRGPKPTLTTARIAQAAIAIADAGGLPAVSIQRVATEFDFTTMALYRYVPSKAALIALMIDHATDGPPDLGAIKGWRPKLHEWTLQCREIYRRHPWILQATSANRRLMGPNELAWFDAALAALSETGLTPAEQHHAFLLLIGLVRTSVQQEADSAGAGDDGDWGMAMADLMQRHGNRYPALLASIQDGAFDPSEEDSLEFGLHRVLDGLELLVSRRE
jgi:AcrR family transcriptional regulator